MFEPEPGLGTLAPTVATAVEKALNDAFIVAAASSARRSRVAPPSVLRAWTADPSRVIEEVAPPKASVNTPSTAPGPEVTTVLSWIVIVVDLPAEAAWAYTAAVVPRTRESSIRAVRSPPAPLPV